MVDRLCLLHALRLVRHSTAEVHRLALCHRALNGTLHVSWELPATATGQYSTAVTKSQ